MFSEEKGCNSNKMIITTVVCGEVIGRGSSNLISAVVLIEH